MKNELQIFNNKEFGQVRVIMQDNNPWFVGKDIAGILGYKDTSDALKKHVDCEDKGVGKIPTPGGRQNSIIINESGMYSLILSSKLRSAKKFKKWVTGEILPSIRKHGAYLTDEKIEEVLTNPDTIIKLATQLKNERAKRIQAERFNNQIAISENSLLVRQVAKIASKNGVMIGEKRLWKKLRGWGLIFKSSTEPKQEYVDRGYFEIAEGAKETYKGTFTYRTTRVTGKGQVYIVKRLVEENMQEEAV